MTKKQKKNLCGEIQDFSTCGLVYTDLIEYAYDQKIFVSLPNGTKRRIKDIVQNLDTGEIEIKLENYETS